jgi:DedD protein
MQRIVGALVLVALAVVFVPMLFNREDPAQQFDVVAPPMPATPAAPEMAVQPVEVPEPVPEPSEDYEIIEEREVVEAQIAAEPIREVPVVTDPAAPVAETAPPAAAPSAPSAATAPTAPAAPALAPAAPAATAPPAAEPRLDASNLPVSWSVQLASLSSRANAEKLQQTLRSQGYNAYIRTVDGMNRVFVGPLVERKEADRLREQLQRQQKLNGFVVRFRPEGA